MKIPVIFGMPHEYKSIFDRIGLYIAGHLKKTKITANQVTVSRQVLCIIAFACLYKATYINYIIAAVLLESYLIFDCVDGYLARLKNSESKFGDWFDRVFDTLLSENFTLFGFFLALGIYRNEQNSVIWIILFFNIFGSFGNNIILEKFRALRGINDKYNIEENKEKKGISRIIAIFLIWYDQLLYLGLVLYKPLYNLIKINPLLILLLFIAVMRNFQIIRNLLRTLMFFKREGIQ